VAIALGAVSAFATTSMFARPARSQAPATPTTPAAHAAGSDDADDEDATAQTAHGLTAPADPAARASWLASHAAAAITAKPALGKTKLGIAIVDLATGKELFAHDADVALNLASNTKLLTSVAALTALGPGFRWHTAVLADDLDDATGVVHGDLYVRGRGDPTLSAADVRALAADVAARGVRKVEGQLVIDASYFDDVVEPPHFSEQPDERSAFRAPVAALGVAKSGVTVIVTPEPGGKATVRTEPDAGDYVKIVKADVATIATGHTRVRIDAVPKKDHLEISATGQIRPQDGSFDARKRVDDPTRFAAEVIRRALAERGVKLAKKGYALRVVPAAAKPIASHDSAPLAVAIREMNKLSDNYLAESVLKTLGAETRTTPGPATWADGTTAVTQILGKLGITGFRADNGSGLFAASAVSAHTVVALLRAAHADFRIAPDLVESLPLGGVDGTLAKRWHGHAARGRVRAKTGTLDHVSSLAGYVAFDSDHEVAFAFIANDIATGNRGVVRALADELVDLMAGYTSR